MIDSHRIPRGIRNNNPLNIRISGSLWHGKVPLAQNTDGAFEQFDTIEHGLRAAILNIRTIVNRRRRLGEDTTVKDLINIWAPSEDGNDTLGYVEQVTALTGLSPHQLVELRNKNMIVRLIWGMSYVETGWDISINVCGYAYGLCANVL